MGLDERRSGNKGINKNDDLEVLLALKRNIFRELKVASLGEVKEVSEKEIKVSLFPIYSKETEIVINCFKIKNLEINKGDVVLVIFLDRNFIQNLNQTKNNQKRTSLNSNNIELHDLKQGIIIGIM